MEVDLLNLGKAEELIQKLLVAASNNEWLAKFRLIDCYDNSIWESIPSEIR